MQGARKIFETTASKPLELHLRKKNKILKGRNGFLLGFFVVNFGTFSFEGDQTD